MQECWPWPNEKEMVFALILERHLIPEDQYKTAPIEAQKTVEFFEKEAEIEDSLCPPTGIALYNGKYYVVQTAGQGPYIVWDETRSPPPEIDPSDYPPFLSCKDVV